LQFVFSVKFYMLGRKRQASSMQVAIVSQACDERTRRERERMNERMKNQEIADRICRDLQWQGRRFRIGDCVALLDGKVVAVADHLDGALQALRSADPAPTRGMVVEVAPPTVDVIRSM
jgi:hypothetical protein